MGHETWTVTLGAFSADVPLAISLDDYPHLPRSAVIDTAVIYNNSDEYLTLPSLPGEPQVDPGGRPEYSVDGRFLHLQCDAALSAGDVKVTLTIRGGS